MTGTRYCLLIPALALALHASFARSEIVEPGRRYAGETVLEFPSIGVSFTLPAGWMGVLPEGGDFLIMQSESNGAYLFATGDEMTVSEAEGVMNEPIDLGEGIVLHPRSEVAREGNRLSCDYSVTGAPEPMTGAVRTIIGDSGIGVSFLAVAPIDSRAFVLASLDDAVRSLVLAAVPAGTPAGAGASTGGGAGPGDWSAALAGRKLTHFFTRTGYTEEDYIWLCADGRFYHTAQSGGFGGGASGAFQSRNGGRWSAAGTRTEGTLTLRYGDGSVATYTVTIEGTKLFLDGKRYFREETDCR